MPVKVLSSAWRVLAGLYRLPGQTSSPPGLELDLPVQPVHDLSREAEYQRQAIFEHSFDQVILAGTTDRAAFTRPAIFLLSGAQAALGRLGLQSPNDVDVWLDAIYGYLDPASDPAFLTVAQAGVIQGGPGFAGADAQRLFLANGTGFAAIISGGRATLSFVDAATVRHNATELAEQPFPVYFSDAVGTSALVMAVATAGGAVTVRWTFVYRFVPIGVRPVRLP